MRIGPEPDKFGLFSSETEVRLQLDALAEFIEKHKSVFFLECTPNGWAAAMKPTEQGLPFETELHVGRIPTEAIYRLLKGLSEQ